MTKLSKDHVLAFLQVIKHFAAVPLNAKLVQSCLSGKEVEKVKKHMLISIHHVLLQNALKKKVEREKWIELTQKLTLREMIEYVMMRMRKIGYWDHRFGICQDNIRYFIALIWLCCKFGLYEQYIVELDVDLQNLWQQECQKSSKEPEERSIANLSRICIQEARKLYIFSEHLQSLCVENSKLRQRLMDINCVEGYTFPRPLTPAEALICIDPRKKEEFANKLQILTQVVHLTSNLSQLFKWADSHLTQMRLQEPILSTQDLTKSLISKYHHSKNPPDELYMSINKYQSTMQAIESLVTDKDLIESDVYDCILPYIKYFSDASIVPGKKLPLTTQPSSETISSYRESLSDAKETSATIEIKRLVGLIEQATEKLELLQKSNEKTLHSLTKPLKYEIIK